NAVKAVRLPVTCLLDQTAALCVCVCVCVNGCYAAYINPVFEVLFVVFTSCPYRLIHVCFPDGLAAFRTFLKSEFSDENIEFWMACEEYKKIKSSTKLVSKANKIFQEFIDIQAPREVNIDYRTREKTKQSLEDPSPTSLNEVQAKVYSLMEKDSYPRFLRSKMYQEMINRANAQGQRRSV
uniref:Regulator of G-protein signaling 8 n=1 Tax=Cyclopterus lumpus TaxID=8103 RepID=A0A8C2ZZ49_CYCLU